MVVLEGGGSIVTIGNNQYLQPDYLSPVPTTLDTKKSPLALLAQTCSQIGADSTAINPISNVDKKKSSSSSSTSSSSSLSSSNSNSSAKSPSSSPKQVNVKSATPPMDNKVAFKPYETNVLSPSFMKSNDENQKKRATNENVAVRDETVRTMSQNSAGNSEKNPSSDLSSNCGTPNDNRKSVSPSGSSHRGASPIKRSGMEVLYSHAKEMEMYKNAPSAYGANMLSALGYPSGMEQHMNPAFRPPFAAAAAGYAHHHAAMLAAAAASRHSNGNPNPYITYQRIQTPSGGETVIPICKDPMCTGCPYSAHSHHMMMGAPCPSGCNQCESQKYGLAMAASMNNPYTQAAAAAQAASAAQMRSPYVCSWISGDSYCGKRYNTSEELFSHLRTHTGNLSDPAAAAAALAQSQTQSLFSSMFPQALMQRGYPAPQLSPVSAARYHPYGKPPVGLPEHIKSSPFPAAAFQHPAAAAAALSPYYVPYAMYGQRIGSAAVHQ